MKPYTAMEWARIVGVIMLLLAVLLIMLPIMKQTYRECRAEHSVRYCLMLVTR